MSKRCLSSIGIVTQLSVPPQIHSLFRDDWFYSGFPNHSGKTVGVQLVVNGFLSKITVRRQYNAKSIQVEAGPLEIHLNGLEAR